MAPTLTDIIVRLSAALLCGAVLGWEREARGKAAGFRTNMLIALGTAAFTLLSLEVAAMEAGAGSRFDPLRAIQGVIGGIGFLGAGAVIRSEGSIHGMTTAATVWVVGAIGIACGIGSYSIAIVSVIFCFIVLTLLDVVARRFIHDESAAEHQQDRKADEHNK
ncbi:MAG: MgtC/SapB family protein [Planctomycetes bacterium]|nr:MgtC/SapB family protein [Planctomycetota bacterium]